MNTGVGLQYGAYPPKVAKALKCSMEEAEVIFNRYHNELYPSVTEFRENYVLPVTMETGKIHCGLGFYLNTDNPKKDIRTTTNASSQFWSILTLLAINELHKRIDAEGLQEDILVTSTIYDSIYFEVRKDVEIIKWLNDNIVEIMVKDFIKDQVVPNEAQLEIGPNWSEQYTLSPRESLENIAQIIYQMEQHESESHVSV